MKTVYLDNNATRKVAPEVIEEMLPYFSDLYGNPSSMHTFGGQGGHKLREAREQVAAILGCDPTEIVFTGCGTESDNAAIKGRTGGSARISESLSPPVSSIRRCLPTCRAMANQGYFVIELGVDRQGRLDLAELESHLDDNTALVTIMYANNETGVIFPIEKIGEIDPSQGHSVSHRRRTGRRQDPAQSRQKQYRHAQSLRP